MTEQEIQDTVANLGATIQAQAIDLAVTKARIAHLERRNAELESQLEQAE